MKEAKRALGDERMSDRELGERLGYAQQTVAKAKSGNLSDPLALKLAAVLRIDAGELLLVAHAEREPRADVKAAWMAFAKKVAGRASQTTAAALAGVAVVLGLMSPPDARAGRLAESEGSARRRLKPAA